MLGVELHAHSVRSDGGNTVETPLDQAQAAGLDGIVGRARTLVETTDRTGDATPTPIQRGRTPERVTLVRAAGSATRQARELLGWR